MAERTCFNCVYCCCDPCLWLRWLGEGESIVPQCANHPLWPGRLHEVPGIPCRNYRRRPGMPPGDVRMIALTDGGYVYVDAADYEWLNRYNWHLDSGYAARYENSKTIYMHREILPPPKGMLTDHIDGNRVNNCRVNLRHATHAQNTLNQRKHYGARSIYKGVFYSKDKRKWYARCSYQGRRRKIGYFDTEIEAARAYDRKAVEWLGEFARLNFPNEWPPQRRAQVYAQRQEPDQQQGESDREQVTGKKRKGRGGRTREAGGPRGERSERVPRRSLSRSGSPSGLQAGQDHGRAKAGGKKVKTKKPKPRRARRARRGKRRGE